MNDDKSSRFSFVSGANEAHFTAWGSDWFWVVLSSQSSWDLHFHLLNAGLSINMSLWAQINSKPMRKAGGRGEGVFLGPGSSAELLQNSTTSVKRRLAFKFKHSIAFAAEVPSIPLVSKYSSHLLDTEAVNTAPASCLKTFAVFSTSFRDGQTNE